jgi:WD40 repeat protein
MKNDRHAATNGMIAVPVHSKFDLDGWWWTMVVLGFLIIGFFGFCFCIDAPLSSTGVRWWHIVAPVQATHCTGQWRSWEIGAVIWSILFGIYYFVRFPLPNGTSIIKAMCLVVFIGATIPNMLAAYYILEFKPAVYHVFWVIVGALLFMFVDFWLFRELEHKRQRGSFLESLLMADLPVVVGLSFLLLYLFPHFKQGDNSESMEAFAGGAISFQLIASNVIFILSQGGFIRWVWESHVPKYIHEVQIETEPEPWLLHLLSGSALMFGLCGAIVAVVRRFDGSGSPWLSRVGLVMLIAALGAGGFGLWLARRLARRGPGPCNSALALGAVGLLCLALFTPPRAVFEGNALNHLSDPPAGVARVAAMALSPDGGEVALGSDRDNMVKVIHTGIGKLNADLSLPHGSPVLTLAFSANGKMLASGGKGLRVVLWDAETGKRLHTLGNKGHRDTDALLCLAFSPDGTVLAGGGSDGTVYLWDAQGEEEQGEAVEEPSLTLRHDRPVYALAFSPDGNWLAGGREASGVLLRKIVKEWLVRDGKDGRKLQNVEVTEKLKFGGFGEREVSSLVVSADGERVAAGFNDGSVFLWERTDSGTWQPKEMEKPPGERPVLAQLFSEETGILVSASATSVTLWDTRSGVKKPLPWTAQSTTAIAFSGDGRTVASGSDVGTLSVWQPQ